jgi:hypothetical protein
MSPPNPSDLLQTSEDQATSNISTAGLWAVGILVLIGFLVYRAGK